MNDTSFRLTPNPDDMASSDFTDPDTFTTGDKTELNWCKFANDDETILVGVWECAPCREVIDAYPVHEMMTVISGSVTLTHQNGLVETFTAGDSFFIAKGSRMTWEITEKLRKYYMIVS